MNMDNTFNTIGYLFSLIISENFDSTVNSLSDVCNLPTEQTRNYLSVLLKNKFIQEHLTTSSDDEDMYACEELTEMIVSGDYDDMPFAFYDMEQYLDDYTLIPINAVETSYLRTDYPKLLQNQHVSLFEMKQALETIPDPILKRQEAIQNSILNNKKIEFTYQAPRFNTVTIKCTPVKVTQNLTSHLLYLMDADHNHYRLDRMKSAVKQLKEDRDLSNYTPNPYLKYFWGTEEKKHGEPIHVKLQISPGPTNILSKIKSDTALRQETCKLYKEGSYYYYEDDILGIEDFRRWVRIYGASVKVLEPEFLTERIVEGANRTLEYYENVKRK